MVKQDRVLFSEDRRAGSGWGTEEEININLLDESMDGSSSPPTGGTKPWADNATLVGEQAWVPLLQELHGLLPNLGRRCYDDVPGEDRDESKKRQGEWVAR